MYSITFYFQSFKGSLQVETSMAGSVKVAAQVPWLWCSTLLWCGLKTRCTTASELNGKKLADMTFREKLNFYADKHASGTDLELLKNEC